MRRHLLALLVCFAACAATMAGDAPPAPKDTILRKQSQSPIKTMIETETAEGVIHRVNAGGGKATLERWSQIDRVMYAGMDGGTWAKGNEARSHGDYEVAADLFHQLAAEAKREWEKVYGSFAEGECLELAGKYDQAALAYDLIVQGYAGNAAAKPSPVPRHRLWMDALYHKGMCLALQKKDDEAHKIISTLFEIGKRELIASADARGNAILSLLVLWSGDMQKFKGIFTKVVFSPDRETETWFHCKVTVAEALREQKKAKEAAQVYREVQSQLATLNAISRDREVQVALGLGLSLLESDQRGPAVMALVRIDAMPYGSSDQHCAARCSAAEAMWQDQQKLVSDVEAMKKTALADWAAELEVTARFMATAAANAPGNSPYKARAKTLLQTMGPDKNAPSEADEEIAASMNRAPGSSIVLAAGDAKLLGTLRHQGTPAVIAYWSKREDTASWQVQIAKPGTYAVSLNYSLVCPPVEYVLTLGDQSIKGIPAVTKSWEDFAVHKAGNITVAAAGTLTLTLKPTQTPNGGLLNLLSVTLTQIK